MQWEVQSEIRLPKTQGIAGHVATTGTLLNIKDAYSHPLFYRGIDDSTGFRTRNILCFPIKDEEGVVLGVAQLCNKKTGTYFTTFDEDIASAFAVYCCISISHSLMYKKVIDIQYRNSLANELMMFHMKQIPMEEVQELANQDLPRVQVFHKDFNMFSFPPRQLTETRTPAACRAMFEDLGFISRWRLKSDTLARFLLMVKKGYRNPPYHNWMHAFSVAHFGYLCIKNLQLVTYLEDIELFALFVSCLCHDIDHRGTTNSFQVKSQSVLAALYSSEGSVMERHHLAQSMCILNTEGSNIFENLSSKEYQQVLDLMRDIILATDVAHHLRIFSSLEEMATNGYTRTDPKCRNLLLCLLMTASDLSDQTKTWDNTKHIAVLIYQEFFSQGDLEKALGESPLEMMDRERACVPDLQISFLDNIAIPVYRVLAMVFPQAKSVQECVLNNRKHWERKAQLMKVHNNAAQTMSVQEIIALGEEEEVKLDTNQHNGR
ncbi:cGMP-dependent 3',5'-cyclic phosphodiesterase [Nucella lapillus]